MSYCTDNLPELQTPHTPPVLAKFEARLDNTLRSMVLFLCLYPGWTSMTAHAEPTVSFISEQEIKDWAERSSYGGSSVHTLTFKQKQLLVVSRDYGSGVNNSRPSVFVKTPQGWLMVLESDAMYPHGFEYQIRKGFLEIYARNGNKGIDIRFNLDLLP